MIILDYVRELEGKSEIVIPPFHTGHLGFVPDTEVHVGLLGDYHREAAHYEVLIAPFKLNHTMTRVSCTMRDEPGVVKRLVDAISKFNINIATQESSSLHRLKYHRVNLILDWNTAPYNPRKAATERDKERYRRFERNFPTNFHNYMLLFEEIVTRCGDVLVCERVGEERVLALSIQPLNTSIQLPSKYFFDPVPAKLERAPDGDLQKSDSKPKTSFKTHLQLPEEIVSIIARRFGKVAGKRLFYILTSETDSRVLHVFFPTPSMVNRIVHVGFSHEDIPGALSSLLGLIRDSKFNIVASLLRQAADGRNTWEAILEYQRKDDLPQSCLFTAHSPQELGKPACRWVAKKLREAAERQGPEALSTWEGYDIQLHPPSYPRPVARQRDFRVLFNDLLKRVGRKASEVAPIRSRKAPMDSPAAPWEEVDAEEQAALRNIRAVVINAQAARIRPKVFLSYPKEAKWMAAKIRQALANQFEFFDYFDGDNRKITEELIRRIQDCDAFVALWHPEHQKDRGATGLSVWLPFEFGIAKAERKATMRCRYMRLDSSVCRKIEGEIAMASYYENSYEECLTQIGEFLNKTLMQPAG